MIEFSKHELFSREYWNRKGYITGLGRDYHLLIYIAVPFLTHRNHYVDMVGIARIETRSRSGETMSAKRGYVSYV